MMLRAGDSDDGVGGEGGGEVAVGDAGDVGTRGDPRRSMLPKAAAISSMFNSGDFLPERFASEDPDFVICAVPVSVGKHASTSKRTIIFISSISCFTPPRKAVVSRSIS